MTRVRQFSSLSRRFCESKLQMRNSKPYISVKPMILSTSQQNNRIKEEIIRTTVSKISKEDFKPNLALQSLKLEIRTRRKNFDLTLQLLVAVTNKVQKHLAESSSKMQAKHLEALMNFQSNRQLDNCRKNQEIWPMTSRQRQIINKADIKARNNDYF